MDKELIQGLIVRGERVLAAQLDHLDELLNEALAAIQFSKKWHQDEARKMRGSEYRLYLERVHLKLQEAIKQARATAAARNYNDQFQMFVRAAAAARQLDEELARKPPRGLLAGWADAMEDITSNAARQEAFTPDPAQRADTAARLAKFRASRGEGEGGGDDGGMGAGLSLDPKKPDLKTSTYEDQVAAHRATTKKKPPPPGGSGGDGPAGP